MFRPGLWRHRARNSGLSAFSDLVADDTAYGGAADCAQHPTARNSGTCDTANTSAGDCRFLALAHAVPARASHQSKGQERCTTKSNNFLCFHLKLRCNCETRHTITQAALQEAFRSNASSEQSKQLYRASASNTALRPMTTTASERSVLHQGEHVAELRVRRRPHPFEHRHFAADNIAATRQPALQCGGPVAFPP